MRRTQRQHDAVLDRRGLQLEVELAAEALAQRQPPGAIQTRAHRRMNHQMRVAHLIEKSLQYDVVRGGQAAERGLGGRQVFDELLARQRRQCELLLQPLAGRAYAMLQLARQAGPQTRHGGRQLSAAPGRFAEPERNVWRLTVSVLDIDFAGLDSDDAVGRIAELKNIAGQAFEREVFVQRAGDLFRQHYHVVIELIGNRTAVGDRDQARPAPGPQTRVDRIEMEIGRAAAAPGREPVGQHCDQAIEIFTRQVPVRPGAANQREQARGGPLAARNLGHDLLGQHIQRRALKLNRVELTLTYRVQQRGALDQVVPGQREQAPLG